MLSREAANTNFIVFGLTDLDLNLIYRPRGEYANHYTTDVVYEHLDLLPVGYK